jgi:hypothetical protein
MSPLSIVLLVLGILALVATINVAVWIPILRRVRRLEPELRAELERTGERVVRGPERASYCGATDHYSGVQGLGVIALTDQRLVLRKALGKPVDLPVGAIVGAREAARFLRSASAGRTHLVVQLDDGTEVGYYVSDHAGWLATLRALAAARAPR